MNMKSRFYLSLSVAVLSAVCCQSAGLNHAAAAMPVARDSIRVLAIGNSFADNALTYFGDIANAAGKEVQVGKACLGGCDLERHMQHIDVYEADPSDPEGSPYLGGKKSLPQLLGERPWDFVTIQQVSHKSFRPASYHPHVDRLIATIRQYAPQAEIVIHQTWAYRDDHGFFGEKGLNTDSMFAGLCAAYDALSRDTGFRQIPSGDAMEAARQDPEWGAFIPDPDFDPQTAVYPELPKNERRALHNGWYGWRQDENSGKWFLARDCIHANREGKYLLGCVWFEFFFGKSVVENSFLPAGMSPDDAAVLQRIAHQVVSGEIRRIIDGALAEGKKHITIPPGRYGLTLENGVHLALENLSDITVDAAGAELVCNETTQAIRIRNCTNLTIRGLSIDYDPLPFTQGRIIEISEDRKSHTIEIMDGFPPASSAVASKHAVFRPDGTLRFGDYFKFQLEVLAKDRLRVFGLHPRKDGGEQVGDYVVVASRHGRSSVPHAIHVRGSVGMVLDGVTLYSSPGFGFFETHCSGSIYRNCVVDRKAGRMRSLNADAFHSKHAEVGPQIIGCKAMWQGDDCVNICGDYHVVSKTSGDLLRILAKRSMDIRRGDPLELVGADGVRLPDAKVLSVKPAGNTLEHELAQLKGLRIRSDTIRFIKKAFVIRIDRKVDISFGGLVAAINRKGNGFAVKDCHFGNNRSRGILIKASNGEVSGNRVENCHSQGIKIAPELYWLESGYSRNLIVSNNTIINSGDEALLVGPMGASGSGFEQIEVIDNRFESRYNPPFSIPATGVVLKNNEINGAK